MKKLFWTYDASRFMVYWIWFLGLLLLVGVVASISPKAALAMVKVVEPIAGLVRDFFWMLMPEDMQPVRKAGRLVGKFFRKVTQVTTSDRTQFVVQMAVLDGFLFVTLGAHLGRWVTMPFIKGYLIRVFVRQHQEFDR